MGQGNRLNKLNRLLKQIQDIFNEKEWGKFHAPKNLTLIMLSILPFPIQATSLDTKQIEELIQITLPNASIGIYCQDADTGKILYERRGQELFPPASTTKLLTAAAALQILGPEYQYKTTLRMNKDQLKDSSLKGNLYVQFSGDPSLTSNDLVQLIQDIKKIGIKHIEGDLVIDNTRFNEPYHALGWNWDSMNWYFAPPITTVILNENAIQLTLDSNKPIGKKAAVSLELDETLKANLKQDLTVVSEKEAESQCQILVNMDDQNKINIGGCWPFKPSPNKIKLALKNPDSLAKQLILETLKSDNIQLSGKILLGRSAPNTTSVIASHVSKPLSELLKPLLQDSNNIYAESMVKTLGFENYQKGTFQLGILAIQNALSKSTGIDFSKLKLVDGSGLSHYNAITPSQLGSLLYFIYHDDKIKTDLTRYLPVAGECGTLKGRDSLDIKGRVQAKTGSMMGVSALAGYVKTINNRDLIVVVMIDHFMGSLKPIRDFECELCKILVNSDLNSN